MSTAGDSPNLLSAFDPDDYLHFAGGIQDGARCDREVAEVVRLLDMKPPMRVLDVPCGFGRHANRLAALGYDVVGVDLMAGFLEQARAGVDAGGLRVDYRQADMRSLCLDSEFDRALMLYTSFGYFDDSENLAVLRSLAQALKPGGLLGLDVPNRDLTAKNLPAHNVVDAGGDLLVARNRFDMLTGRWTSRRTTIRGGVRESSFSMRLYNATELCGLLSAAGLELVGVYGGWDGGPLSVESRSIVPVARRPLSRSSEC